MGTPRLSRQTVRVLQELMARPTASTYGYDLMRATGIAAGTLYPILSRLADHGWVAAEWGEQAQDGRPARHHYRLTALGRRAAADMIARARATGWDLDAEPDGHHA